VVQRAATHFGHASPASPELRQRATDRLEEPSAPTLDELVAAREQALRGSEHAAWGELIEHVLVGPAPEPQPEAEQGLIRVDASTRWG